MKKLFGDLETDYLDGFQYKSTFQKESWNGEGIFQQDPNEVPVVKLRIIPTSEGYYDALLNQYVYNFTDHLGNVRLSYTDTNKDGIIQPRQYFSQTCDGPFIPPFQIPNCISTSMPGEIVEVNNYYPFGMMHNYTMTTQNAYQYKYNGKELQESGMYDYGARMYMADLGRWGVIDPLAEISRRWSTYAYAYNNPVMFIDPDGMQNVSALHWKFEQNSTILGNSWFDDSYVSSGFEGNFKSMWNGGDHGGSGGSFLESQMFKDAMDYLAQNQFFQEKDFIEFMDPPGNGLSRFRQRTANWVQENIRGPLSGWFDTHTRNAFVLDAEGQARMDDLRGQMTGYMRSNVGGGIRWGAEHGLVGSGMGTGHVGKFIGPKEAMRKKIADFAEKANFYSGGPPSLAKNSEEIIEGYYQQMKAGKFNKPGGGFITLDGKTVLTEGNHSMNAAIRYAIETGDIKNIKIILKGVDKTKVDLRNYSIPIRKLNTK